ncbi:MAG TPA: hypothetical protein VH741_02780, partial [Candidatus Limnocylindrales bacterium]
ATDAHHPQRRPPLLAEAREAAAKLVGAEAATDMVLTRPAGIVADAAPDTLPPRLSADARHRTAAATPTLIGRLFGALSGRT